MRSLIWGIQNGKLGYLELMEELFLHAPPEDGNYLASINDTDYRVEELSAPRHKRMFEFSVLLPTYNRKSSLISTLSLLTGQKNIEKNKYEIIIIDDGCTDGTYNESAAFAKLHPEISILYIRNGRNRGPAFARNVGIRESRGEYIACTDDDCRPDPYWLSKFKNDFFENPDIDASGGFIQSVSTGMVSDFLNSICLLPFVRFSGVPFKSSEWNIQNRAGDSSNICFRRRTLEEMGGFNHSFRMASEEDWELKIRLHKAGCMLLYNGREIPHEKPLTPGGFVRYWLFRGWGGYLIYKLHPEFSRYHFTVRRALAYLFQEIKMLFLRNSRSFAWRLMTVPLLFLKYVSLWAGKYFIPVFFINNERP